MPSQTSRFCLAVLVLLTSAVTTPAALYQTISVNVMSPEVFRVARIQYPISEMATVVAGEVRGNNIVQIKLFVPLGLKKEIIADIKERCRKAGAKAFFIVYKS